MSKILIAPKAQYGYNTDYYQMANRLAEKGILVEVVCFDQGYKKMNPPDNVQVKYVHRTANKAGNYVRHMIEITKTFIRNRKMLNWVVISSMIELSGILPFVLKNVSREAKWILDVRTCSVVEGKKRRHLDDRLLLLTSRFFNHITIISELVAKRLKISRFTVLPLGAECYVDLERKSFDPKHINFLYVGTFDGRKLEELVEAFDILCSKRPDNVEYRLDMVGYGEKEAVTAQVTEAIGNARYRSSIIYHGRKTHQEIHELFQTATIGFSYVPVTDFFDVQPPTKTYEYMMNGIICIGTPTKANAEIIKPVNGILAEENTISHAKAMEQIVANLDCYDSRQISESVSGNDWQTIVNDFFEFLNEIKSDPANESTLTGDVKELG